MKNYFITALLGLLVACGQNSTPDVISKLSAKPTHLREILRQYPIPKLYLSRAWVIQMGERLSLFPV